MYVIYQGHLNTVQDGLNDPAQFTGAYFVMQHSPFGLKNLQVHHICFLLKT